jgi:Ca2+-binding RTX toxin-like protein
MAITNASLKPFMLNATDIQFLLDQVKFRPLFDSVGNAIINWNGVGAIYNGNGQQIWDGTVLSALDAIAAYGSSYQSITDLSGLRDPSGFNNNLTLAHANWGQANQIFPRMAKADFTHYSQEVIGVAASAINLFSETSTAGTIAYSAPTSSTTTTINVTPTIFKDVTHVVGTAQTVDQFSTVVTTGTDGHHAKITETITDTTSTVVTTDYNYDNVTTTTYGTTAAPIVRTQQNLVETATNSATATTQTDVFSGGELDTTSLVHFYSINQDLAAHTFTGRVSNTYGTLGTTGTITNGVTTLADYTNPWDSVVDYTPRMISRLTTTAGVTYDTWANHQADHGVASHHLDNEIYYDANGVAKVLDWGQLETVANGGLGQVDTQARFAGSAGEGEKFIGGLNPGVSPSNGFFVLFGQFFDHGLDFIDKGGQKSVIKIALAVDDPLYGMTGSDGQPVTSITISRANVDHTDANGPEYVNHTSPFIDQSQTYGSSEQLTTLLREWVPDSSGVSHAGMNMLDGNTLAESWVNGHGETVNATLPTLNELNAHIVATGRDALIWEDVLNLRNRDAAGHVIAGNSGSALILDMNPRFDAVHLHASTGFNDANHDGIRNYTDNDSSGTFTPGDVYTETGYVGFVDTNHDGILNGAEQTQVQVVDAAIQTLSDYIASGTYQGTRPGDSFGMVGGILSLTLATDLAAGPSTIPAGTYTGANAMMLWVNFGTMGIMLPPGALHTAVSDILLAAVGDHYIAGDGRVNENFGLTSIHHIFHEEHNFQVQNLIEALHTQDVATGDTNHDKLHEFQVDTNGGAMNAAGDYIDTNGNVTWDMDKMFNATKLIVEMEYQHAAVDQYARNVTPNIQEFVGYSPSKDPSVTLEYAQGAFRFGHSTLRETIDTIDPTHGLTGKIMGYALRDAFLNPDKYADIGPAAILLGMSHQQMNEVDEFITPALNQGLLGQALDLAAINIARGRDIGLPTLNQFRADIGLAKYTSWQDFGQNMQHPQSLVNFIAAYSFDGDLAKAAHIIGLADGTVVGTLAEVQAANTFLNGGDQGFNLIDTWLGGLAEIHQPGGLLGETFDLVFVTQIESLMDGDRFYYLYRLAGQQFAEEVGGGQLKDIVERNSGLTHLNGNIFGYADQYIDFSATADYVNTVSNEHKYGANADVIGGMGIYTNGGLNNASDGTVITLNGTQYVQDTRLADTDPLSAYAQNQGQNLDGTPNSGAESNEVIVGTAGNDLIYAQGGDDTVYGEGGDDIIFGGFGIDRLYGGAGSDTIYGGDNPDLMDGGSGDDFLYGESSGSDINGNDQVIGGSGNDFVSGGTGIDKLSGGTGDDHVVGDADTDPFTHGSDGNDWIEGNSGGDILYGDNGDDFLDGGADQDQMFGGNGDDIIRPGDTTGALTIGTDEVLGGDGVTDAGNKPGTIGFDIVDFSDNAVRPGGVDFDLGLQQNPAVNVNGIPKQIAAFQLEGIIGSAGDDTLTGNDNDATPGAEVWGDNWLIGGSGSDTLTGNGGDDVIIGGSIRLDALVGSYTNDGGDGQVYDNNNDNAGLTADEVLQDARYQGASHRALYTDAVTGGLLSGAGFATHFTEMLRSDQFKDMMLGDGGTNGSDTAVYSGNMADYSIIGLDVSGIATTLLLTIEALVEIPAAFAYKIIDNRIGAADGTDILVGISTLKFSDGSHALLTSPNLAPVFTSFLGAAAAVTTVAENATAVATLTATDPNVADILTFSIVSGADASLFDINATTGALTFKVAPNFEMPGSSLGSNVYDVVVQVSDGSLAATQSIAVTITDVNEAPVFGAVGAVNFAENTDANTIVATVTATDQDLPPNAITYTLTGTDSSLFSVDGSGNVTFNTSPDFESAHGPAYHVNVIATDNGSPTKSATSSELTVNVTDVNEAPTLTVTSLATIAENSPISTVVATSSTSDPDAGDTKTYSLAGTDAALFDVDTSGNVTFNAKPDFENPLHISPNYSFDIVVTDAGGKSDTKAVALTVTNVNEAPTVNVAATASIAENTDAGTTITTATASDIDAGTTLSFTLSGADASLFSVDTGGHISFANSPDFESSHGPVYHINVVATDNGIPILSTTSSDLTINVTNRNDAGTGGVNMNAANVGVVGNVVTIGAANTFVDQDVPLAFSYDWTKTSGNATSANAATPTLSVTAAVVGGTISSYRLSGSYTDIFGPGIGPVVAAQTLFVGTAGNNAIVGTTSGPDIMVGLGGNDVYSVKNAGDIVVEIAGGGTDRVNSTLNSYALTDNVENLTFTGTGNFNGIGNALNNVINGGTGNDTLTGGLGNDTVNGGSGNDIFVALANDGADSYIGGLGADTLDMSAIMTAIDINLANGTATTGFVTDTLNSIENVIGGSGNNLITASNAINVIDGGAGDDIIRVTTAARAAGDTYNGGNGIDKLDMSGTASVINVNLSAGTGTFGGSAFTVSAVENVTTGTGSDTITASSAHNVIDIGTGAGLDTIVFTTAANADGDTILNFRAGDKIDVHALMGGNLDLVNGLTATANNQIAHHIDGAGHTILDGLDQNGNHFSIDVASNHALTGTDFAA